jgi:hypothetical protein
MSEEYKLYLDQMFRVDVAQALSDEGYDVLRAAEIQQNRADDQQIFSPLSCECIHKSNL